MNLAEFLSARRASWEELDGLLRRAEEREVASLPPERARRLIDLYRRASADLIQARTFGADNQVTGYVEALLGRAYGLLYRPPSLGSARALGRYLRDTFPRAVRRERAPFALVALALGAGLLLGGVATSIDPEASRLFIPAEHQGMKPSERVARDEGRQEEKGGVLTASSHAAFSSFLFTHNIKVSILCFAIGVAWGLPTLLLIAYHGVFIAALAVAYFRDGVGTFFLAWILPHGVVEITCILLAGTGGLMLGRGVLWPRGVSRAERLRHEAREAMSILGGCALFLVLAGIIEGTISQIHEPTLPYPLKIGAALLTGAALHAYLWFLPLPRPADDHSTPRALIDR